MKRLVFVLFMLVGVSVAYGDFPTKQEPQTLITMSGFKLEATRLSNSVVVIIDAQREYVDGKLRLEGIDASIKEEGVKRFV